MALDINIAGSEFVKGVLKLYRSAKYFREKEILAQKFMNAAIETGSLITELCVCSKAREGEIARQAMAELSKAMFVLKVMGDEGIYPKRKVDVVMNLGREVKELIEPYSLEEVSEQAPVPVPQPVQTFPQLAEENVVYKNTDRGGFDEVYTGED